MKSLIFRTYAEGDAPGPSVLLPAFCPDQYQGPRILALLGLKGKKIVAGAILGALLMASAAEAAPSFLAAWSRPAAQGTTGVGFLTLLNSGAKPDALLSVETPGARQVQIHQSSVTGGMASMQMVPSVPVPPGGRIIFAPGGYHLMFLGLTKGQKVGDTLPATLVFASGRRVKARFVVGLTPPKATSVSMP